MKLEPCNQYGEENEGSLAAIRYQCAVACDIMEQNCVRRVLELRVRNFNISTVL